MVLRVCAARPGASLGVRDFVVRSRCGSLRAQPHATAPHPCGDGSRCGPAVQVTDFYDAEMLRQGFSDAATRPPGPGTEDGKKSGGRFRLSSVSCGSAALPGPLACSARCGGLPFVRRTLRSRSGFPVLCATLEALRRLSGRVRRRGFAAGVWVRRRGSAAAFPAGHRRARRSWRSVELLAVVDHAVAHAVELHVQAVFGLGVGHGAPERRDRILLVKGRPPMRGTTRAASSVSRSSVLWR